MTDEAQARGEGVWRAHVPVTGTQHDPANGLIHGYCERCRTPWPCDYSPEKRDDLRARLAKLESSLTPEGECASCVAWAQQVQALEARLAAYRQTLEGIRIRSDDPQLDTQRDIDYFVADVHQLAETALADPAGEGT